MPPNAIRCSTRYLPSFVPGAISASSAAPMTDPRRSQSSGNRRILNNSRSGVGRRRVDGRDRLLVRSLLLAVAVHRAGHRFRLVGRVADRHLAVAEDHLDAALLALQANLQRLRADARLV